ncbi:hypothetical protein N4T20_05165 [Flavobacterium sp. TR2]|uniref:hypothetical protein n=1 Tax=Flavobacterium sp. TR2 TaxID=2977321 RepID=UPI0021B0B482|nr:hypothetical protein [Flavobacterium sp. TR2]UWY29324.1 hypothetical protein N4T20_05165 [Flavobacterium sp. TR2]
MIIETNKTLDNKAIEVLIKNFYSKHKEIQGKAKTILKFKSQPYCLVYSEKELYSENIEIKIFPFGQVKKEFDKQISDFKAIKKTTPLNNHTIYGYYLNLGSCTNIHYSDNLYIISKDNNNYFLTSFLENKIIKTDSLSKTNNSFEKVYLIWHGIDKPETKSKEIFYEIKDKDMLTKDLSDINESEEKYGEFYFKLDK